MTEKPKVKLVGEDGNVFAIMARVSRALTQAGQADKAREYRDRVMGCGSYDDALMITLEYVDEEDEEDDRDPKDYNLPPEYTRVPPWLDANDDHLFRNKVRVEGAEDVPEGER